VQERVGQLSGNYMAQLDALLQDVLPPKVRPRRA
jgi:hypothetical protein